MVVHDPHILWSRGGPPEADPPLVVDTNAVLSLAISLEGLQSVLWRRGQVAKLMSAVEHFELPSRDPFDIRKPRHARPREQPLGPGIREGNDHLWIV